jgi:integrase
VRISEALGLTWDDLQLDAPIPHVVLTATKNGKPALVPLSRRLRERVYTPDNLAALRALPVNRNAVRDHETFLFPMGYNASVHQLGRLCTRVGVEQLGWHAFRHAHATRLLQRGVPIHAVSKLLNHSSTAVTQRFYDATVSLDFARYID